MRGDLSQFPVRRSATLAEALDILASEPGRWTPLAGGTDLMVLLSVGKLAGKAFLDLSALKELKGIEVTEQAITFGALCTFTELREHREAHRDLPNLMKSARATGALAIQNRGTLGGNLVNASPAADTPPSLLAYGASLELASPQGRRWVPCDQFFLGYKQLAMEPNELLTRIRVERPQGRGFHFFRKVGTRAAQSISKTCLAAYARLEAGQVAEFRAGLGSVGPTPLRARKAEALVLGRPVAELDLPAILEALQQDISPIDDIRSTARYRRVVTGRVFGQMLRALMEEGAGGKA